MEASKDKQGLPDTVEVDKLPDDYVEDVESSPEPEVVENPLSVIRRHEIRLGIIEEGDIHVGSIDYSRYVPGKHGRLVPNKHAEHAKRVMESLVAEHQLTAFNLFKRLITDPDVREGYDKKGNHYTEIGDNRYYTSGLRAKALLDIGKQSVKDKGVNRGGAGGEGKNSELPPGFAEIVAHERSMGDDGTMTEKRAVRREKIKK